MSLISLEIDPLEVQAIRKALEELTLLVRTKLLADGYLQPPAERVASTPEDVRVVDGNSVWLVQKQKQAQERRLQEQLAQLEEG